MSMSLLIIQPQIEAGKKGIESSGALNANKEGTSQFQSLLDKKMTQSAQDRQKSAEQQSSSETRHGPGGHGSDVSAAAGELAGRKKYLLEAVQIQEEDRFILEDDTLLLARLMTGAAGVYFVPVEPNPGNDAAELAEDASRILFPGADGDKGKPVLAQLAAADEAVASRSTEDAAGFTGNPGLAASAERAAVDATQENAAARGSEITADQSSAQQTQQTAAPVASTQAPQQAAAQADTAAVSPAVRIMQSIGTPEWSQAVGQRVLWMVGQEQHSASLMLNPPDLGPVRIVLSISSNQATANFFSAHPDVRSALEGSLPRLREMLEGAGVELGQTHVGGENQDNQQSDMHSQSGGSAAWGADGEPQSDALAPVAEGAPRAVSRGLIDTFA